MDPYPNVQHLSVERVGIFHQVRQDLCAKSRGLRYCRPIFMTQTQICSLSRQFARRSAVHGDGTTRYEAVPMKGDQETDEKNKNKKEGGKGSS